ncbi:MAG: hypothetical protein HRU70_14000 [Phycisphaeraceae bacterium]|nr:MAG: hypothetical protein HRU70_14000 [Phycisphaeraceae bacterium]
MHAPTIALLPITLASLLIASPAPVLQPPTTAPQPSPAQQPTPRPLPTVPQPLPPSPLKPQIEPAPPSRLTEPRAEHRKPRLIAALAHADWCDKSRAAEAIFARLTQMFDDRPVLFLRHDLSTGAGRQQAEFLTAALNLPDLWKALDAGATTGVIVLVNPETRKVIGVLPSTTTTDAARKAVTDALK